MKKKVKLGFLDHSLNMTNMSFDFSVMKHTSDIQATSYKRHYSIVLQCKMWHFWNWNESMLPKLL